MKRALFVIAGMMALSGCSCGNVTASYMLQRMEMQPKFEAYEANPFYKDDRAMRVPPQGTVPREAVAGKPAEETGEVNGRLVAVVPIPITPALLAEGKMRFGIVCATCHGVLGNGDSMVADNFPVRLPPSLVKLKDKPAGFFFRAATYGFGLMPSFSGVLSTKERWAIVSYIRALQKSSSEPLAMAPTEVQRKLLEEKE